MQENTQNIKELIEYSKKGIFSKEIIKNGKLDVTLFCMAENTEISEHTSTKSGFIFVVEGSGEYNFGGQSIKMSAGVVIPIEENIAHSIKVDKDTSFLLSLIN